MSRNIVIAVHIFPQEIDRHRNQLIWLKQGAHYISGTDRIFIDITLNLNFEIINWSQSYPRVEYYIEKINAIKKKYTVWCDDCRINYELNGTCLGASDARRNVIQRYKSFCDMVVMLDSDICFHSRTLGALLSASKHITRPFFILSSQVPKLWDETWDVLVNKRYLNDDCSRYKIFDHTEVQHIDYGSYSLCNVPNFKFGMGWFNIFSLQLLELTDIPEILGPYGVDDNYVMACCIIMSEFKLNVCQYILQNCVVAEDRSEIPNKPNERIVIFNKKKKYRQQGNQNIYNALQEFYVKLSNKIQLSIN